MSWITLAACADDGRGTHPDDLLGTWRAEIAPVSSPDGSAGAFLRRELVFTDDVETLIVEAFANPEASMALFTYIPRPDRTPSSAMRSASTARWRSI